MEERKSKLAPEEKEVGFGNFRFTTSFGLKLGRSDFWWQAEVRDIFCRGFAKNKCSGQEFRQTKITWRSCVYVD